MKKHKLYLAGPMRGIPEFNFPEFMEAAKLLRELHYEVWNPAEEDIKLDNFDPKNDPAKSTAHYMERDLPAVIASDGIALLPGWEKSEGCRIELTTARALKKEILYMGRRAAGDWFVSPTMPDSNQKGVMADAKKMFDSVLGVENTNPKDLIGEMKPNIYLVPSALILHTAKAMENGAKKYTAYNWRTKKVRNTIYISAAMRHLMAYIDGENIAKDSNVEHLGHAAACIGIILDAQETGNLIDDRPVKGAASEIIERMTVKNEQKA